MKKQFLNLRCGNKAIIFTLDATVAILVAVIILFAAYGYIARSNEDALPKLQLVRTGSDVIILLDYNKSLDTLNVAAITADIDNLLNTGLPGNYDMMVELSLANIDDLADTSTISIGTLPTDDKFIGVGKRFFLVTDNNEESVNQVGVIKYWIWLK